MCIESIDSRVEFSKSAPYNFAVQQLYDSKESKDGTTHGVFHIRQLNEPSSCTSTVSLVTPQETIFWTLPTVCLGAC